MYCRALSPYKTGPDEAPPPSLSRILFSAHATSRMGSSPPTHHTGAQTHHPHGHQQHGKEEKGGKQAAPPAKTEHEGTDGGDYPRPA